MPGARELIETLEQRGMLMGIVSNAQFYTPLVFEALLEKDLVTLGFRPELCAWSYQSREAKPSRRLFQGPLEVLDRQFATPPQQVLYIGNDMLNDIWPASRLGCRTALFAGDRRSLRRRVTDPRCRGVEPDVVVTALDQLLDVL
jgi:putative hydrolase of the HAD superfamily